MRSGQSSREGGDQAAARWLEVLAEVERLQLPVLTCPTRTCAPTYTGVFAACSGHAGLDAEAFPFAGIPAEPNATNERRLRELGPGELEAVQGAQAAALRRLGYLDNCA